MSNLDKEIDEILDSELIPPAIFDRSTGKRLETRKNIKSKLKSLIADRENKAIENFTKNKTVISDFECSEHGKVEPVGECPLCFNVQAQKMLEFVTPPKEKLLKDKPE